MAVLWFVFAGVAYFLPWLVASYRSHTNTPAIAVVNFFLGWTLIGWVAALAWAYVDDAKRQAVAAAK